MTSMARRTSLFKEFFSFIKEYKIYWITPIIITLLFVGILIVFGSTKAAPYFIYTLF